MHPCEMKTEKIDVDRELFTTKEEKEKTKIKKNPFYTVLRNRKQSKHRKLIGKDKKTKIKDSLR